MQKKKKIAIWCISILAGIAAVISVIYVFWNHSRPVLMEINGQEIQREEFLHYARKIKMEVRDELLGKSGKEAAAFQWSDQVDGKNGYEWLVQRTEDAMIPWKIIQTEAEKWKLTEGTDYQSIMKKREEENKERRKTKEKGGVLYGVVEYSESEYYEYFNSNLNTEYQEKLIKDGVLTVSEEEIKAAYEEQKSYFNNEDYETVKNSAKKVAQEEKYQEYLEKLVKETKVRIVDEEAVRDAVKEVLGETW